MSDLEHMVVSGPKPCVSCKGCLLMRFPDVIRFLNWFEDKFVVRPVSLFFLGDFLIDKKRKKRWIEAQRSIKYNVANNKTFTQE